VAFTDESVATEESIIVLPASNGGSGVNEGGGGLGLSHDGVVDQQDDEEFFDAVVPGGVCGERDPVDKEGPKAIHLPEVTSFIHISDRVRRRLKEVELYLLRIVHNVRHIHKQE